MDVGIVSKVSGDVAISDLYVLQDDDTSLLQRIYTLLLCSVGDGTYRPTRTTQIVYDLGSSNIQDINVYRAKLHTAALPQAPERQSLVYSDESTTTNIL